MKKNTKLIGYIVGVVLFIATVVGFTYAMYTYVLFNDLNVSTNTKGLDKYIEYTKGTNISGATLNLGTSYTDGRSATISFYKTNDTYNIYGHIYLDITTIDSSLSSSGALKYAVLDGSSNVIGEGIIKDVVNGDSVLAATNIVLSTTASNYTIYVWLDENRYDSASGSTNLNISIRCSATMTLL